MVAATTVAADLEAAAALRAQAYFENDSGRFRDTFMRQFAEQEAQRLIADTRPAAGGVAPVVCLVARVRGGEPGAEGGGEAGGECGAGVIGTMDVIPPRAMTGGDLRNRSPAGEELAAFVLNVCVGESHRRMGVGRALMMSAMAACVEMGADKIFTQVRWWSLFLCVVVQCT